MYQEDLVRQIERRRCVSIPMKDDNERISALSIDFERLRLHSSSERFSSPSSHKSPFPLKQNSWILEDSTSQKDDSSATKDPLQPPYQNTAYLLPQIPSPGKPTIPSCKSEQLPKRKKLKFKSSSDSVKQTKTSKRNRSTKQPPPSRSTTSSSTAALWRRSSSLSVDRGVCGKLTLPTGKYPDTHADDDRSPGDGCEEEDTWITDKFCGSDDEDALSDLEGELSDQEGDSVYEESSLTDIDEEGCVLTGHHLKTIYKKKSGAPQPPGTGDSKNTLKSVRFSSDSHLYSSPGVNKKLLKKSHSLLVVSGEEKRLQPVGSSTCVLDAGKEDRSSPLTQSLFVGRQPTIHFPFGDEEYEPLPEEQRALLKWKMSPITPNVVKRCIDRVGFTRLKKGTQWLGYWGKHMKSEGFKSVKEHQKVNHFPGSYAIGRKDRLWRSLARMQVLYGKKNFDFVPQTFVLPADTLSLKREWEEGGAKNKWIIKPPAAARGIGIRVVHKWSQLPKKKPIVVQRYISNPYLIRGSKFDLRVYVYVTSYDPLRIYIFRDGLARFATCKYTSATQSLSNRFVHLTNYSINKKNTDFEQNPDETVCQGHKWGLRALWDYMKSELGVDTDAVWEQIKDLAIKTIISSEHAVVPYLKANVRNKWSCHELFGFDVMLDSNLKPWIIEVNISPSLHSNSQLDVNIKGQMVRDILNMCQFTVPNKDTFSEVKQSVSLTSRERSKHALFVQKSAHTTSTLYSYDVLDNLTPDDIQVLMETEDEHECCGHFERVFPSTTSHNYLKYFEVQRYYNILLNAWVRKFSGKQRLKGIALLRDYQVH